MSVRFLIGRSGSGKTHLCLDEITGLCDREPLGPPLIYLVPEQASYTAEKALLSFGRIDGYTRAQVLSFTRLVDYVYAAAPGSGRPRLTPGHRMALTTMLVARRRRRNPSRLLQAAGIEEALARFLGEIKQYAATPARLREAAAQVESIDDPGRVHLARQTSERLRELAVLAEEFHEIAGERFEDPQDTLAALAERIVSLPTLQGARVYIDGFVGFTPVEESLIVALARRAHVLTVSLAGDPERARRILSGERLSPNPVFSPVEETLERLIHLFSSNGIEVDDTVYTRVESDAHRFHAEELRRLEASFFRGGATAAANEPAVEFWTADDPREEARRAAEIVAFWIREHDWTPGDTGILVRDLGQYADHLEEALATLRLPCFIDRSLPLDTHPYIQGIQSLLRAWSNRHNTESLLDLGRSGLLPIPRCDVDLLAMHVREFPRTPSEWFQKEPWRRRPGRSPFADEREEPEELPYELPPGAEAARTAIARAVAGFADAIAPAATDEGVPFREFARALAQAVDAAVQAAPPNGEDLAILQRIGALLDEAVAATGDEVLEHELACEVVSRSLTQLVLPRIPPMLDQVFVGQVDRSRQPRLKGVVVLGLNEGVFPRLSENRTLLNDAERELLHEVGLELRPSSRRQFERETFHAYRAVTSASDRLALLRTRVRHDGSPAAPSLYWRELRRLYSEREEMASRRDDDPARCWRPRELAAAILRRADKTHESARQSIRRARPFLESWPEETAAAEVDRIADGARWRNRAEVSAAQIAAYLDSRLDVSATQLQSMAACAFQHYASYLLRPREWIKPEFEVRDAGLYCHAVLRNFTALLRKEKLAGKPVSSEKVADLAAAAREHPKRRIEENGLTRTGTGRYLFETVDRLLDDLLVWLADSFTHLPFYPADEEASFRIAIGGDEARAENNLLPEGWSGHLRGQIDRIDTGRVDGVEYVLVVDYKLKQRRFNYQRWDSGENLQLPIYLLVAPEYLEKDGIVPAGGLYLEIVPSERPADGLPPPRVYHGLFRRDVLADLLGEVSWRKPLPVLNGSNGDPGEKPRTSGTVISDKSFDALLRETRARMKASIARIVDGDVAVAPSRHGSQTACSYCSFKPVCGIDFRINRAVTHMDPPRVQIIGKLEGNESP